MKEIKLVHIVIAVVLVLVALIMLQRTNTPKSFRPEAISPETTAQTETFPVLPQNERYNSNTTPSLLQELPPFEESAREDHDAPKDPATSSQKPLL